MSAAQQGTPTPQELEQNTTIKQSTVHFFLASVTNVDTQSGALTMVRVDGAGGGKEPFTAYMAIQDSIQGSGVYDVPIAGTTYLCANMSTGASDDMAYALAPVNYQLDAGYNSCGHRAPFIAGSQHPLSEQSNSDAAKRQQLVSPASNGLMYCHAHGMPYTAEPGDYYIMDKETGTGLMVGRLLSMLRGNSFSKVEVNAVNGRTLIAGKSVFIDTTTGEDAHCRGYYVRNTALNERESLGALDDQAVLNLNNASKTVGSPLAQAVDGIPFFRMQHAEGAPVGGIQDMVIGNMANETVHAASSEPAIMAMSKMTLGGEIDNMSTQGLLLLKSPVLYGIHQIGYGKTPLVSNRPDGQMVFDDLREPYSPDNSASTTTTAMSLDDATVNAALLKMVDGLLAGQYSAAFKKIMADKGFGPSLNKGATLRRRIKTEGTKGGTDQTGATVKQFYDLPDMIELEDPVTGETHKYFDSTSFISQEPDGSICIKDGYGSEIRMCRGNIYISPALDLALQSGRDVSVMAGRHQSYAAQGSTTLNGNDTMHIRAVKDLEMVGATGGTGIVSITGCGKNATNSLDKPDGGVLIGSPGDLTIVAGNTLYMGINNSIDDSSSNQSRSDNAVTKSKGRVIVDAGDSLFVTGTNAQFTVDKAFTLLCDTNCFTLNGTDATLVANYTYLNSSLEISPYRNPTISTPDIHEPNASKKEKKVKTRENTALSVTVKGNTNIYGDMTLGQCLEGDEQPKYDDSDPDWPGRTEKGGNLYCSGVCSVGSTLMAAAVASSGPMSTTKWMYSKGTLVDGNIVVNSNCKVNGKLLAGAIGADVAYLPGNTHTFLTGENTNVIEKTVTITIGDSSDTATITIEPGEMEVKVGSIEPESFDGSIKDPVNESTKEEAGIQGRSAVVARNHQNNRKISFEDKNSVTSDILGKEQKVCNDRYIQARKFRFPADFDVNISYLPGMSWQQTATGDVWKLNPVAYYDGVSRKQSEGYPGWNVLSKLQVSTLNGDKPAKLPFATGYKTNSKKK